MLTRVIKKKCRRDDVAFQRDVSHCTASFRLIQSSSTSDGKGVVRKRQQPHKVNYQRPFHLFNGSAVVWGPLMWALLNKRGWNREKSEGWDNPALNPRATRAWPTQPLSQCGSEETLPVRLILMYSTAALRVTEKICSDSLPPEKCHREFQHSTR